MKIYNTLTGKKEDFIPLEEGKVKIYVCGPTVYNLIHIGNARPMVIFDTVRRYFAYKGYDVTYVSNFTDIDDKIIKKANEDGSDAGEVATHFIEECNKDMDGLGIGKDMIHPLATPVIPEMIEMIQALIDKGYAYESNGTVYYRVRKFKCYGKLSGKNIDDLEAGHRDIKVAGEDDKEDNLDFVLWKPKKEGEPAWPSPWSDGRPGWHIECSVMAKKYLGDSIDIHAGGEDLIFPHHENEIAQSEAANGVPFAKYWMHNGFLRIVNKEGEFEKMSKSLGNFLTVRDVSEKYPLEVLRFFMLGAHYRNPINFSDELMESAKNGLERIKTCLTRLEELGTKTGAEGMSEGEQEKIKEAEVFTKRFEDAMDDDFNTADAVASVFDFVKYINTNTDENSSVEYAKTLHDRLCELMGVLGLSTDTGSDELLDEEVDNLIQERNEARKNKDFVRADEIRDLLIEKGIILEDTRDGVRWKRK